MDPTLDWSQMNFDTPLNLNFGAQPRVARSWMSPGNATLSGYSPNPNYAPLFGSNTETGWQMPDPGFFGNGVGIGPDGKMVSTAGMKFGWNAPSLQLGLSGLNTLSGLYFGNAAMKNAKEQLSLAKTLGYANLNNQIASYNTNLKDKAAMRYDVSTEEGKKRYDDYVTENRLSR